MINHKIVRGIFLIVACSAAVALISCQSGDEGVVGTTQENTDSVDIYGTVYCGSVMPPVPMGGVLITVTYYGEETAVIIWRDYTNNGGHYCTSDLSNWWHKTVTLSAYKKGYGPYEAEIYIDDYHILHDIYLYL